jgi:hypothetical protein
VANQFKYSYATGERDHMLYFATFNDSFAVGGVPNEHAMVIDSYRCLIASILFGLPSRRLRQRVSLSPSGYTFSIRRR